MRGRGRFEDFSGVLVGRVSKVLGFGVGRYFRDRVFADVRVVGRRVFSFMFGYGV